MSIQKLTMKDKKQIIKLYRYCFYREYFPEDSPKWDQYFKMINFDKSFGYFKDNKLISVVLALDFECFIRGKISSMTGIAGVATKPEYRRKGYSRKLLEKTLTEMYKNGTHLSALYPFKHSYYRKFGYVNCEKSMNITFSPRNILLPRNFTPMKISEISIEESYEKLQKIHDEIAKKYNFVRFKTPFTWAWYNIPTSDVWKIIIAQNMQQEIVGYMVTEISSLSEKYAVKLTINQMFAKNEQVRLSFLDYIKKHSDQIKEVEWILFGDEIVFDYFDELWETRKITSGGAMYRLIHVQKLLENIDYPPTVKESFTMKITDEYCPQNEKPMNVSIKNSQASVTLHEKKPEKYDIEIDIKAFTQLVLGYRSLEELIQMRRVAITNKKRKLLEEIFSKRMTRLLVLF
ncbi:MAG: GNAT family N-acetyltransferase [Asgard group archaeon]|nr:GNAT family N-acetyltransferase [Asgard group archaeon]